MRTFCWLDTKWLCQNSVIRSVSGEGVASISCTHQARSSSPLPDLLLLEGLALLVGWRPGRGRSQRTRIAGDQAGGGVTAAVRASRSSRSTASSRDSAANVAHFGVGRAESRAREQVARVVVAHRRGRRRGQRRGRRQRRQCRQSSECEMRVRHRRSTGCASGRECSRFARRRLPSTRQCARLLTRRCCRL